MISLEELKRAPDQSEILKEELGLVSGSDTSVAYFV